MYEFYNPNPAGRLVGDCAVRAVSKALDVDWETAYTMICANGFKMGDMPSSDSVWGATLRMNGFYRESIPNNCPECYTAEEFCRDNPNGIFVLGFGNHTCCVISGTIYDSWDSSQEIPQFYWHKEE